MDADRIIASIPEATWRVQLRVEVGDLPAQPGKKGPLLF
jgi:hypothetical protein